MEYLKRGVLSILVLAVLFLPVWGLPGQDASEPGESEAPKEEKTRRVLMLSSANLSFVQHYQVVDRYLKELSSSEVPYAIDFFEMDTLTNMHRVGLEIRLEALWKEIQSGKYDLITTFGEVAFELLNRYHERIPKDVAIVFLGSPTGWQRMLGEHENLTGVVDEVNPEENIKLIRKLLPEKKKLLLLTHWGERGLEVRDRVFAYFKQNPGMELIYIDNDSVSTPEMLKEISKLNSDAAILFYGWYNREAVNFVSLHLLMNELGGREDVPLFVMNDVMLQFKTMGGNLMESGRIGATAGKISVRILRGEPAYSIPVHVLKPRVFLNWNAMKIHQVSEKNIPEDAIVLGKPQSYVETYWKWFLAGGTLLVILLASSASLLFLLMKRRQYLWQMNEVFYHLPMYVGVVDERGNILLFYGGDDSLPLGYKKNFRLADLPLELVSLFSETVTQVMATGEKKSVDYTIRGLHRRVDFVRLPDSAFNCKTVLWASVDVEELNLLMQNERTLNKCLRALNPAEDAATSFQTISTSFCHHFQADRCGLLRYDLEAGEAYPISESCAEGVLRKMDGGLSRAILKKSPWLDMLCSGEMVFCDDVQAECGLVKESSWGEMIRDQGVKSLYAVPIFYQGKLWGIFGLCFEREKRRLTKPQIQLIQSVATTIEILILRQSYFSEISEALEKAREADRAKSIFLATMSHELRTPLNAVIGYADLLLDEKLSRAEIGEYAGNISLAGKALLSLINDILDLSKIEADQMKIVPAPTDIKSLFEELGNVFQQATQSKGIGLQFDLAPYFPQLYLDELRLRQILFNLIGNAIKFTHQGAVIVSARYEGGHFEASIEDTGIGIGPEHQKTIFEPFVQQDAVRDSRIYKGTGLGLSISQKLAEKMGGTITLKSMPEKGSIFTLRLESVEVCRQETKSPDEGPEPEISTKWSVLLVDDVGMNLRLLELMFQRLGIRAATAASGEEALKKMSERKFDLVFTDLWMPGMSGEALAQAIREKPDFSGVRIVAVTADTKLTQQENRDFDEILLKPVTLEGLKRVFTVFKSGPAAKGIS